MKKDKGTKMSPCPFSHLWADLFLVRILIKEQEVKQSHYVLRIFPKVFCFPDMLLWDLNLFIYIFSHIYIRNGDSIRG